MHENDRPTLPGELEGWRDKKGRPIGPGDIQPFPGRSPGEQPGVGGGQFGPGEVKPQPEPKRAPPDAPRIRGELEQPRIDAETKKGPERDGSEPLTNQGPVEGP